MSLHKHKSGEPLYLIIGLLLIILGIYMILAGKVASGIDYLTQLPSGYSGWLLILMGVIILVVYYHTLSPFSRIRTFFEGKIKPRKKKSD